MPYEFSGFPRKLKTACVFTSRLLVIEPEAESPIALDGPVQDVVASVVERPHALVPDEAQPRRLVQEAENELGIGETSLASSPAIPDRVPDPPISPTFTDYGDGKLMLQWAPPLTAADFTAIQKYEIAVGGQTLSVSGSTTTLIVSSGLANGTSYTFRVRAQNRATTNNGWGDFSSQSASEKPSRYPDAPTAVTAANAGDGGTPRLTVRWSAPAFDGGRPISQYKVCQVQNAANCQTIASGLQATFDLPRNQASSFTVVAYNSDTHKNDSPPSAASAVVVPVGTPDVPVISRVDTVTHAVTAVATTGNNSGCSTVNLEYSLNGGGAWQSGATFSGLTNGTSYTVVARAVLPASCGTAGITYASAVSAGVAGIPYGPMVQPTMNSSISGTTITWSWATNRGDDGRPGWNASLSGSCASAGVGAGTYAQDFGWGPAGYTCSITVSAPGQSSLTASSGQTTPAQPIGSVSITVGSSSTSPCYFGDGATGNLQGCYNIQISMSGWTGTHTVRCYASWSNGTWVNFASFTAGNGTHNQCSYSSAGRGVVVAVDTTVGGAAYGTATNTGGGGALSGIYAPWPTD